jgi:hypothetical protein
VTAGHTLRKATAQDIARQVAYANGPLSENAILSGAGLGDAQIGVAAAFNEAIGAGLNMPRTFYVSPKETT